MRILITGGFGFLGSSLSVHLAQAGHQIIIGTRNSTDAPGWLPQAKVVKFEWDDEDALESNCNGVDMIIHAAGMNAKDCATDPGAALEFNGAATTKLFKAASRASVKKFIYLSTAHVYANPLVGDITEKTYPSNLHPYATSHLAGEDAVLNSNNQNDMKGVVLRLSNVFGVPMNKDVNCWMLLVNDLCKQAVETGKLVLYSNGLQQRDFISLPSLCYVTEKIITQTRLKKSSVFNVGAGVSQTVLAMAQLVQQRCMEVLSFTPELQHKLSGVSDQPLQLTYHTDNLNILGINCKNHNNVGEIDALLKFCKASFNNIGRSL
jgi:UDP-glucose 4-epimerase